jgi:AraC-like DNA-binding protein
MQFESIFEVFDTVRFSDEQPVTPLGELFSYCPPLSPESLHYHNFLEIGYCEYGSGVFVVDGELIPFSGKCASIIYEGQTHIAQSISPEKSLWHFLYIDPERLYSRHNTWGLSPLDKQQSGRYTFKNLVGYEESPELYELVRLIHSESAANAQNALEIIRGLVYALLMCHDRMSVLKRSDYPVKRRKHLNEIADTINYINMKYAQEISIGTLTGVSRMSKANLQRKFLSVTGMSPIHYLHYMRVNRAAVMLLNDKHPIAAIAMEVGYGSLSSFNRHFLKLFHVAPSVWRKSRRQGS